MNHLPKALRPRTGLHGWPRVWYVAALSVLGALFYFIGGKFGLALAIPPGYATAIWPPSGIAVVLLLAYGYQAGFGVLLGSFLLNLTITFESWADITSSGVLICFVIGTGACLQAALAVALVRKTIPTFPRLMSEADIPKFLVFAGLISCVVNATIAVSTLILAGAIPVENFAVSWITWYFGDTIGVVFVAPLLLMAVTDGIAGTSREKLLIAVPVGLSFLLTIAVYMNFSDREEKRQRAEVQFLAEEFSESLHKQFDRVQVIQKAIEGLFVASSHVTPEEFKTFATLLLQSVPELHALSWNPVVPTSGLPELVGRARSEGLDGYTVREREADGRVPGERIHVPILYIEPFAANKLAQGFDIASDPIRRAAVDLALQTKKPVSTAPINLVQVDRSLGFLLLHPVLAGNTVTGFAVAVLAYADLVGGATSALGRDLKHLGLRVLDKESGSTVYQTGDWTVAKNSYTEVREISIAQRQLVVFLRDAPVTKLGERGYASFLVLAFGLLLSTLISAFILTFAVRRRILERAVDSATLQVKIEREKLEEAARLSSLGEMAGGIAHEINNPLAVIDGHSRKIRRSLEKLGIEDDSIRQSVEYIHKTVDRISQIIVGLRKLARDGSADDLRPTSVRELVAETVKLCSEKFRISGVELTVEDIPDVTLLCRPVQISQVLLNLLTNAFQAASRQEHSWIRVAVREAGQSVLITVTDSGRGVSDEVRTRMFEPFFTTKEVGQGTGLGLSTSRSIVHAHDGELLYDTDGGHTRFSIRLPAQPAFARQTARSA